MDWRDTGILLSTAKHGETALILEVFTPGHGRHTGVLRNGTSRRIAPAMQPGAQLDLRWRARLADHMGSFAAEPVRSRAAVMSDRQALAGLRAVLALLSFCLPEREAYPALYDRSEGLLDLLPQQDLWPLAYLRWELALLGDLGFALDLSSCALTGSDEGLAYLSPRTGRAVTAAAAGDWAERLLPLPPILRREGPADLPQILAGLATTGFFLENRLAPALQDRPLPAARAAFVARLEKAARG